MGASRCSNPASTTAGKSTRFGLPAVALRRSLQLLVDLRPLRRRRCPVRPIGGHALLLCVRAISREAPRAGWSLAPSSPLRLRREYTNSRSQPWSALRAGATCRQPARRNDHETNASIRERVLVLQRRPRTSLGDRDVRFIRVPLVRDCLSQCLAPAHELRLDGDH
jgi:hypothetical protein